MDVYLELTKKFKDIHFDKLKGFYYVEDYKTLAIGDVVKYVDLHGKRVSATWYVYKFYMEVSRTKTTIRYIILKCMSVCKHAVCKAIGYSTVCPNVKIRYLRINPRRYYFFNNTSLSKAIHDGKTEQIMREASELMTTDVPQTETN